MDWSRIRRNKADSGKPAGVYANLDELIRVQFKVSDFSLKPSQPVMSILSGRYGSRLRGRGLNFEEVRRYQQGDDIRTIDWKITARTRSPHVRVYTEEKDRAVLVVVDQRINMFFGTRTKFKSVTAAEIAAISAWRAIDVGDRIGAIVFNDEQTIDVAPRSSQQNVMSILSAVIRFNHQLHAESEIESNASMLNLALERAVQMVHHDALIILVSDFYGIDEQSEKMITRLAAHNDVLALYPFDPMRHNPANRRMTMGNGRHKMEIDFSNRSIREKIFNDYQEEQERISHFLRKLSAPLLMINNEYDVSEQLRKYLGVVPRLS